MAATAKSVKSNEKARQLRQEGNRLFQEGSYDDALTKYTESICWAERDSEHLGIAYGNLSAVFYESKEYEFALAYISLAKRHNYPERLMPKLEARARNCLQLRGDTCQRDNEDGVSNMFCKLSLNVKVNPRIPHIASGIHMEEDSSGHSTMVADRDFKVGDVILTESSLLGCLYPTNQYQYCDYCFSNLMDGVIPCPHCVSTAYCNEQCLEKGWNAFHRFECDIRQELNETALKVGYAYTGLRVFLYGLGLFKDDVDKMMEFCKANPRTGSDPLKLDFVNYDPMEEFKTISTAKHCRACTVPNKKIAFKFYKTYRKNPMIRSLFSDNSKKCFMLQCFVDYLQALPWCYLDNTASEFYTVSSNFSTHSYAGANITRLAIHGHCKLMVHRPVKKGNQLLIQQNVNMSDYDCKCSTLICTSFAPNRAYRVLRKVVQDPNVDRKAKANAYQQYIQAYAHLFNECYFRQLVKAYHKLLEEIFMHQLCIEMRVKVMSAISSP